MIVDIGYFSMLAAMALVLFSIVTAILGIRQNSLNLIQASKNSLFAMFIMVLAAYLALSYAFVTDDFSVRFVALHSSTDLPLFYKATAVWGGMEGSLLLWQLILSFFTILVIVRYKQVNREILPHTLIVCFCCSYWSAGAIRLFGDFPFPEREWG
jgi:cytochrome c-type biogenesis protein CcmF